MGIFALTCRGKATGNVISLAIAQPMSWPLSWGRGIFSGRDFPWDLGTMAVRHIVLCIDYSLLI